MIVIICWLFLLANLAAISFSCVKVMDWSDNFSHASAVSILVVYAVGIVVPWIGLTVFGIIWLLGIF